MSGTIDDSNRREEIRHEDVRRESGSAAARRDEVLREELERRLAFLEEADDSAFGDFTNLDWLLCTLLFFVLPLLLLGVMVL